MSVLKKYFDKKHCHSTPIQEDFEIVKNYDEDGTEYITWKKVDYPKIVASNGKVSDWSLNNLLRAGIDPAFSIHTGLNTRLEGIDTVNTAASEIIDYLDSLESEDNNN